MIPMINLVRAGFGTWQEILEMKEKYGLEYLQELQAVLGIISQEEASNR